ncbi:AbrB/MazE/SpoVT family DNA-binding domain-containing protein [Sutterella sp.]|uniref:AbrB/MazE/SpoVT family DNA-binding domain-containing protein n=1 Tax=Sutterella sp. TaxID=1981025 RepID=UPI0026DED0DD|nr:AbrB/MazE/SpoVT family DNA-binding domain-containing protein [Sutterella sp.]MDO5531809.1 AbrB/MazE/SpoVT family DNA-binding domain-containing protein [Sutterella sp.]
MTTHRLTIKGQVTIPKEIRDYLGLAEGNSSVDFAISDDGTVVIRKAGSAAPRPANIRTRGQRTTRAPQLPNVTGRTPANQRGGVLALLAGGF